MNHNQLNNNIPKLFGEAFDNLFNTNLSDIIANDFSMKTPSVNVLETEDKYTIELAAPGLTKKDFKIELDKDQLKISSQFDKESNGSTEDFVRREFNYQSFVRSFTIPKTVDTESISANYKNGILSIQLAKREEAIDKGPKTINIK